MISMSELWLPIVVAALVSWVMSCVIHIVIKYHNADYKPLANEDEVATAIRNGKPGKGIHSVPYCVNMKEMASEAMQKKFKEGPVAFVTVFDDGMPNMGKLIGQQILFFLFGMTLIAYCASLALPPGADYMQVFRLVSAVGFVTYGWGLLPFSIWYGHPWGVSARFLLDAIIYALLTAGVFAWLWPGIA